MDDPTVELREILFPRRGLSATELLIATNLVVAGAVLAIRGSGYTAEIQQWSVQGWTAVHQDRAYGWFLPTLFLHVGPGHLASNMLALLGAAGAVEFLAGGGWAILVYLVTGLAGAWVSYAGHGAPPLSVGASGAVFGLLGCTVSFIIRRRGMFNYAKRWKVWRVYLPLFLAVFLPALVNADIHAHAGGFVCGLVMGLFVPPHRRVARLGSIDSLSDDDEIAISS